MSPHFWFLTSCIPLPIWSAKCEVGFWKILKPDILEWEVGSPKVGSGPQTRILIFKSLPSVPFRTLSQESSHGKNWTNPETKAWLLQKHCYLSPGPVSVSEDLKEREVAGKFRLLHHGTVTGNIFEQKLCVRAQRMCEFRHLVSFWSGEIHATFET